MINTRVKFCGISNRFYQMQYSFQFDHARLFAIVWPKAAVPVGLLADLVLTGWVSHGYWTDLNLIV